MNMKRIIIVVLLMFMPAAAFADALATHVALYIQFTLERPNLW